MRLIHNLCLSQNISCNTTRRTAILLLGGDKTGNNRWYDENVPRADALYDEHLATLKKEKLQDG